MTSFSTYHLDFLKSEVLKIAEINHITSADCRILSSKITAKTKQRISETTIKRIYGFALSNFKPSSYTIDAMANYCGYEGWTDFYEKYKLINTTHFETDFNWQTIQQNADKITNFTLTALKNRSGIPYNQTIKRVFIDQHFENYLQSDCVGTVISGYAGYGKTIALCHWVEQRMAQNLLNGSKDIILFFSSNALMSVLVSGRDINDWMLALLGYSAEGDLNTLLANTQKDNGKFYLIVDGFDEYKFKNERFNITLSQLIDILALHKGNKFLRVILTMRPSTWINYRHEMESVDNIWYTGFKKGSTSYINVPLFNIQEIKELAFKINPLAQNFVADDVVESFNHPLYFQFYYKEHKAEFSFNNIDRIVIYELLSAFIYAHVYLGKLSVEKVLLLKALIEDMDINNPRYPIDNQSAYNLLKQYSQPYQDLLNVGIFREVNESRDYQHTVYVEFGNHHFLEYSFANCLLNKNNGVFDRILIQKLNKKFNGSTYKLPVLKWCIMHAVKGNQWENFDCLTETVLCANEKSDLVIFLSDLLAKQAKPSSNNDPLTKHLNYKLEPLMFDYFFGLELISPYYKKTLTTLLKFELSTRKKILVYSALGAIAVIQLDMDELYTCLLLLKSFSNENYQSFIINPLNCLDTIYTFFKYGIVNKDALVQLTKLLFYFPEDADLVKESAPNDLIYLLALHTMLIADNPKKTIRMVHLFKERYKDDKIEKSASHYNFFVQSILADAYFKLGDHEKVSALYFIITQVYKAENLLTPYMKSLLISIKIKMLVNTPDEKHIFNELKCLYIVADESGNKLVKLYITALLLNQVTYLNSLPQFQKQLNYDFMKIIRENELNRDAFKFALNNDTEVLVKS